MTYLAVQLGVIENKKSKLVLSLIFFSLNANLQKLLPVTTLSFAYRVAWCIVICLNSVSFSTKMFALSAVQICSTLPALCRSVCGGSDCSHATLEPAGRQGGAVLGR